MRAASSIAHPTSDLPVGCAHSPYLRGLVKSSSLLQPSPTNHLLLHSQQVTDFLSTPSSPIVKPIVNQLGAEFLAIPETEFFLSWWKPNLFLSSRAVPLCLCTGLSLLRIFILTLSPSLSPTCQLPQRPT